MGHYISLVLHFFTAVLIAGSFPIQVFSDSPLPSLLPYVLLFGAAVSRILHPPVPKPPRDGVSGADGLILAYVFLIVLHMFFYIANAEIIKLQGLLANVVNFLLPVAFYLYFRYFGLGDLRAMMSGVLVASLVIGGVSAFHSYKKIHSSGSSVLDSHKKSTPPLIVPAKEGLQCVTKPIAASTLYDLLEQYQWKAAEYSRVRSNQDVSALCHSMRFNSSRSAGLLENHAVNSAWISLGMLAALVVIPRSYGLLHIAVVLSFGGLVYIFQYFTGILAWCLIALMILVRHFHITGFARLSIHRGVILSGVSLVACPLVFMLKPEIVLALSNLFNERLDMLVNGFAQTLFFGKFQDWTAWAKNFPVGLFVGDGFGIYYPYSFNKGGDIGLIESLAKLGLPLSVFILIWLASKARSTWRMARNATDSNDVNDGFYFLCLILFVAINEIHYSVWSSKAVIPILFVAIAVLDRLSNDRSGVTAN